MGRLKRLRELLNSKGIDAALIVGRPNTLYLSGFSGTTSYFLVSRDKAWLIIDFRYTIQAGQQVFDGIEVVEQKEAFTKSINEILVDEGIKSLGFDGGSFTYSEYERFKDKLSGVRKFVNLGSELDVLRIKKDDDEIEAIAEAVSLGDKVFDYVLRVIKPGIRESELAAEMEYQMKKLGAKGASFETIVASGLRSAMCHGTATDNVIKKGDSVVLDFGVSYRNYCSDMTRTLFMGTPNERMKTIYEIVKKAQQAGLDCLVSGMNAKDADKTARDIITKEGYGHYFGHSLGHGVGIEVHENPRLSEKSQDILSDGMVFTVEPGIYVEGLGGVRIEDMVVLTGGKPRILTSSTKDMIIL